MLATVIKACRKANKPVTLCGEMAGQPRAFVLLFAMGLRSFSMSPAFIPSMKELAAHLTEEIARRVLRKALTLRTTAAVKRYMAEQLSRHRAELADARYGVRGPQSHNPKAPVRNPQRTRPSSEPH